MTSNTPRKFGRSVKLQHLCEQIHHMAVTLGPDAKLPTVVQLSEELNVSKATINSALRELEEQHIVTRRHGVGLFVSGEVHQKTVSLICDSSFFQSVGHSPFWDILLDKARVRAESKNELFELHLAQPHGVLNAPLQRGIAKEIEEGQVHGVIGVGLNKDATDWIEAQDLPFVAIFGPAKHSVLFDVSCDVELGVASLISQGRKRLGFWQPVAAKRPFVEPHPDDEVAALFRRLVLQSGLTLNEPWIQLNRDLVCGRNAQTDLTDQEQGFKNARTVFGTPREQWPDGIIISNDLMAHGALMALQQMGIRVGTDVDVACHANKGSRILNGHQVPLTLIEYDADQLVETSFSLLESMMEAQPTPEQAIIKIAPAIRIISLPGS